MAKKKTNRRKAYGPAKLYEESPKEYRLRQIHFLLLNEGSRSTDDLVFLFADKFAPASKEVLQDGLRILSHRGLVTHEPGEEDRRVKMWVAK